MTTRSVDLGTSAGYTDVPVFTTGYHTSYYAGSIKQIHLEASLDGPPGVVTDAVTVM